MIILDFLTIILLIACIGYSYLLHMRINSLQKTKLEFSKMVREFDLAIIRAETSVEELTKLSNNTSTKLQKLIDKSQTLVNDLTFMNDMGGDIAERLEAEIHKAQALEKNVKTQQVAAVSDFQRKNPTTALSPKKHDIETLLSRISSRNKTAAPEQKSKNYFDSIKTM